MGIMPSIVQLTFGHFVKIIECLCYNSEFSRSALKRHIQKSDIVQNRAPKFYKIMEGEDYQKKEKDPKIVELRRIHEEIKPRSLQGDQLQNKLKDALNYVKDEFEFYLKRPDGSRFLQVIFRRGNQEIREQFIQLLLPHLLTACQTKYEYRVIVTIIKRGNTKQNQIIFDNLFGEFGNLLKHKIGCSIVNELYQKVSLPFKNKMLFDICWDNKKNTVKLTEKMVKDFSFDTSKDYPSKVDMFEDYSKKLVHQRNKGIIEETKRYHLDIMKHIKNLIEFAGGKGLTKYRVVQEIINEAGNKDPTILGTLVDHMKDLALSPFGSMVALRCIHQASASEIRGTLITLEPMNQTTEPPKQVKIKGLPITKSDSESEDEQPQENAEDDVEEEEEINEDGEQENVEEEEAPEQLNETCKLATNEYGWRVLSAAISYLNKEPEKEKLNEVYAIVLSNLLAYWDSIKGSKYAQQLFYRMLTVTGSIYMEIPFQPDTIDEGFANAVAEQLIPLVPSSIQELSQNPQGSGIIVELLKRTVDTEDFSTLASSIFTEETLTDKAGNKLIKMAIQKLPEYCVPRVQQLIDTDEKLLNVLKTPGAFVVAELCLNDKNLAEKAKKLIEENKLEEKDGIKAILYPKTTDEKEKIHRQRRHKKSTK